MPILTCALAGLVSRIPLSEAWTGTISLDVYRGRLTRAPWRLTELVAVCPGCGQDAVLIRLTVGRSADSEPVRPVTPGTLRT